MVDPDFKASRISKTSTIHLKGQIEKVFPLFGAFEERKWAHDWNPAFIYPSVEHIEEGTTFITTSQGYDENKFLWIVSKYDLRGYMIQYLVSTENRYWTITIKSMRLINSITASEITYSYTALNYTGLIANTHFLQTVYHNDLKDWEEALNHYLTKGKMVPE